MLVKLSRENCNCRNGECEMSSDQNMPRQCVAGSDMHLKG